MMFTPEFDINFDTLYRQMRATAVERNDTQAALAVALLGLTHLLNGIGTTALTDKLEYINNSLSMLNNTIQNKHTPVQGDYTVAAALDKLNVTLLQISSQLTGR